MRHEIVRTMLASNSLAPCPSPATIALLIAVAASAAQGQVVKIIPPRVVGDHGPALDAEIDGPSSIAADGKGNLYVYQAARDYQGVSLRGIVLGAIRRIDSSTHKITTVALGCDWISDKPRAPGCVAPITELRVAPSGKLLLSEYLDKRLRELDPVTHQLSTIAGKGTSESSGDGGSAVQAGLAPSGFALDRSGNIFIADSKSYVRRVDAKTGIISTVAGNGKVGSAGDGGLALAAQIEALTLAIDRTDDLYIGEDSSGRIRRVDAVTGTIETIAGGAPLGTCAITQFCGEGGPGTAAHIYDVRSLALDRIGNVLFATGGRVCRIDRRSGVVTTIVGTGEKGSSGDGGPATKALVEPAGIAVDGAGNLFIADYDNNRIRRVDAKTGIITTVGGNGLPHRQPPPSL
jgi:sugar lactone lactonase YvrE